MHDVVEAVSMDHEETTEVAGTEAPCEAIRAFVSHARLVPAGATPRFSVLVGGVSSDIWKVEAGGRTFVVKKALARLRVAREWLAPPSRNATEVDWLSTAGHIVPGCAPAILAHDAAAGLFAMEFLDPASFPVWKSVLRAGAADPAFAGRVGGSLAAIHSATAGDAAVARSFSNDADFHALRLDPYLHALEPLHPALVGSLAELSRDILATKRALVHGDISPKNILVGPTGPVFLDAECAWYGDPAFDLAFCLNHMLLKMLLVPEARRALRACFETLAETYLAQATFESTREIEGRAARILPALLLARVDGKSPVEYVTAEPDRERVRRTAVPLILAPPTRLAVVADRWARELDR